MKILLSIKPFYADKILNGEKKFELRRVLPKNNFDKILIYASAPISNVIGEVSVGKILRADIHELRNIVGTFSSVTESFFYNYFEGKEIGYAIELLNPIKYKKFRSISKYCKRAPQSFVYIK